MESPKTTRPAPALGGSRPLKIDRLGETIEREDSEGAVDWQAELFSLEVIRWLHNRGVSGETKFWSWPIGAANVKFTGATFAFDSESQLALTFLVEDCSGVIGVVAWQLHTSMLGGDTSRLIKAELRAALPNRMVERESRAHHASAT